MNCNHMSTLSTDIYSNRNIIVLQLQTSHDYNISSPLPTTGNSLKKQKSMYKVLMPSINPLPTNDAYMRHELPARNNLYGGGGGGVNTSRKYFFRAFLLL